MIDDLLINIIYNYITLLNDDMGRIIFYDSKPFHKTNVTSFNKRKTVRKLTTPALHHPNKNESG
jgi:hypothetical protein